MFRKAVILFVLVVLATGITSCGQQASQPSTYKLIEVAQNHSQWTGIAVSPDNRIFVNFPLWSPIMPTSVGELMADGTVEMYPDVKWNSWVPGAMPVNHFICVQSVVFDSEGFLWVLDPANPFFRGVIEKGPKLVKIDIDSGEVVAYFGFPEEVIALNSYLNDVRIDSKNKKAYITDSGVGAILIVDLKSRVVRRVLDKHYSTKSEDVILTIEGQQWIRPDGVPIQVHSDGIALDSTNDMLYYQALTGRSLYRISIDNLLDTSLSDSVLESRVELVGQTGAADGIICGPDGRIYLSSLEDNSIKAVDADGMAEVIVSDSLLSWSDSFAFGPDGTLYVTTSQIHKGTDPGIPYRIFKVVKE